MPDPLADVSVFVRVRPLLDSENETLPGLTLETSVGPDSVALQGSQPIAGFAGVLGQTARNQDVFDTCFAERLPMVLRGGTASLFCYGYTGGGKTHTVLGAGSERGMYSHAAEALLRELHQTAPDQFLSVTVCELYKDDVVDLLGERAQCVLKCDQAGQLHIFRAVVTALDETGRPAGIPEGADSAPGLHQTLVTRMEGLRPVNVHCVADLEEISRLCEEQRATGCSTVNTQSSRSHAILRMEIVNEEMLQARAALECAKAELPARRNACDNWQAGTFYLLAEGFAQVLRPRTAPEDAPAGATVDAAGAVLHADPFDMDGVRDDDWVVSETFGKSMFKLQGVDSDPKSVEEWAEHFGTPPLVAQGVLRKKALPDWGATRVALAAEGAAFTAELAACEAAVDAARRGLEEVMARAPTLGGAVLIVDLAGADYDHRAGSEQKESAAINKSLLALKECFRSLAKVAKEKPKFRDSKLTRILEDSLAPAASTSRRNRESGTVMLMNVSPAAELEKMTLNTMRYGQLYASAGNPAAASRAVRKPAGPDPEYLKAELRRIYSEHAPEKTAEEVEGILGKFAGREQELLRKARAKYCAFRAKENEQVNVTA